MSSFHAQVLGSLVKRGAEHLSGERLSSDRVGELAVPDDQGRRFFQPTPGEMLVLVSTGVIFLALYVSIKYTIGNVVASLAMIEEPRTVLGSAYKTVPSDDKSAAPLKESAEMDVEVVVVQEKPITGSIRQTIGHITQVGGYTARWRGLAVSTVYHFLHAAVAHLLGLVLSLFIGRLGFVLGAVSSTILLARIHMTWTHVMISPPSTLPWYKRVPHGRSYFKVLFSPAAIYAISQQLTVGLPLMVYYALESVDFGDKNKTEAARVLAVLATAAFVALAILLPASVTLTRVEASLLPEDVDTLVSFDRTLGGAAVNLAEFNRTGLRAMYDAAWRSFDKASRVRMIKFYAKYFAIVAALWVAAGMTVGVEMYAIAGDQWTVLMQQHRGGVVFTGAA